MKVALYARVSSEKQEKDRTIESQISQLREHTAKCGYVIVEEYFDDGFSGEMIERPALDRLRDDAKKKIFEKIVIHSPDRLSRDYVNQRVIMDELKNNTIEIEFLNKKISDSAEDQLLLGIEGLFAEYEKTKIKERVRRGRIQKAKNGLLVGGYPPFGYRYLRDPKARSGNYEIIEGEAKVVRLIFDLVGNKGLSIYQVIKELGKRGHQPRGRQRKAEHWARSTIHRILKNETYIGTTYYNKHKAVEPKKVNEDTKYRRLKRTSHKLRPRNEWFGIQVPRILEENELFYRAQKQIERNRVFSRRNTKHDYLLRGLLKCSVCGSNYLGTPCHGKFYYRCSQRQVIFPLKKTCTTGLISADRIESKVWDSLREALGRPSLITRQIPHLENRQLRLARRMEKERDELVRSKSNIKDQEIRLLEAYSQKIISLDQLQDQMLRLKRQEEQMRLTEAEMKKKDIAEFTPTSARDVHSYCRAVSRGLTAIEGNYERRRRIVELLVNKIIIDQGKLRIQGAIPVIPRGSIPNPGKFASITP